MRQSPPDGSTLSFTERDPVTGSDVWILPRNGQPHRAFATQGPTSLGPKWEGFLSPDGRLVACTSQETGRLEVYVRPLQGPGKRQVSTDGGNSPVWAHSGRDLFYLNGDRMMAVGISGSPQPTVGPPRALFDADYAYAGTVPNFDVAPDDQSFVMIRSEQRTPWLRMHVVLNWFGELEQDAPHRK